MLPDHLADNNWVGMRDGDEFYNEYRFSEVHHLSIYLDINVYYGKQ